MLRMRESKRAKNAKDDDEKRKRGESEKGYQQKQVLKIATQNKGEVELLTFECCSPTDNCGNGDNSLTESPTTRTITST